MKKIILFSVITCFILLASTVVYSQKVLCSFETEADVKTVQVSSGVTIRQTEDFAALNAHALQCLFPDQGGKVTIQKFSVPSWSKALGGENQPVDALLVFAWASQPGELELLVEDSSSQVAGTKFNLKAGANHLQLPFAKLTRLNTDKIKSFSIGSSAKAEWYLDYIALDQFQDVLAKLGRWDVGYSDRVKTAHFPWGSDFVEKINTYSISPVFDGRGIIELSERLPLNYRVATLGRNSGINRWGFGDFYNRRNPGGDDGDHPYSLAFDYIADDLLFNAAYDVIIWPGLHPWESYPQYIREEIMKRVNAGTGLVLLYPSGKDSGNFSSFSPLTISASVNVDSIKKLNHEIDNLWKITDTSQWVKVKDHYITRGVELKAFPFGSIGVLPFNNNNGEVLLKTRQGNPVMAVRQYGKGRIVAMAYLENGFIPMLKDPWETGLHNAYWEYMWSMVARSVVWAAAKEPQTAITGALVNASSFIVSLQKTNSGDSLAISVEDEFGTTEKQFSVLIKPQQASVNITLPANLNGGGHIVNFRLKGRKGVYDWYSLAFTTPGNAEIVSITNEKEEVPSSEQVHSNVKVFSKKPFEGRLVASLYDNYNRLVSRQQNNIQFNGNNQYDVALDSKNILSHLGRVEVVLTQDNKQADRKTKDIFFLQPRKWDDYDVTLYHFGPNPIPGTWPAIDSQLRNMNVTTLAAYTLEQSRHANYKVQAQTRISGVESPDNGPDLLYYDSIKARYLQTHDKKVLVRKYGLNDSAFLRSIKNELGKMVPQWRKFSPSAYYVYEEPSVTRYDDALDLDFSETTLRAMRNWLRQMYPSIKALNEQWGTSFQQWEEVVPDDSREAQQRGNYSSWADHRSFMEKSWAGQFEYVQDALHRIDPGGLVQLSGTQASGAHNGYDYSLINKHVGQMNPYDIGNQLEYHHDFNPALKISGQAGYGASGKSVLYDFYQHIFVNETGGAYIFWQQSALNPDLTLCQSGLDMQHGFTEMREKGIGKLVASYNPENENRIAVHYSYPSIHAAWIVDGRIKPGHTYGNTSETLEQFRRNLDGWVKILQDAGLGFDFTSYSGIENGDLATKGYKVLILPMSTALSDAEVKQIESFVKDGGTVISDALPGIMDAHARFRNTRALAGVFGVKPAGYTAKDLITPSADNKIILEDAKSLLSEKNTPQLIYHSYGKGNAFMLNYFLDKYPEQKAKHTNDSALARIRTLFTRTGIAPAISITDEGGRPVSGIAKYSFSEQAGKTTLLGLLPDKNSKGGNFIIHLENEKHVYDIRNSKYVSHGKDVKIMVEPWVPALMALMPGTIDGIVADPLQVIRPGGTVNIHFAVKVSDSMKLHSVLSIAVYDPSGKKIEYYGGNCDIINNTGEYQFSTAINDMAGRWKVEIREAISGKKVLLNFDLHTVSEMLLPVPQQVKLTDNLFKMDKSWSINNENSIKDSPAILSLQEQLLSRFNITLLNNSKQQHAISFIIKNGAVKIGNTTDTNRTVLMRQAYRLEMTPNKIMITANAAQGLYYGVQSLLQLFQKQNKELLYPEGELTDWPNMNLRMIYWDDAHHLEKLEVLKREIKQASLYKINGFALKLEGHFQYKSAAPIVEPHALSAAQYQELTDYAAAHYVQLIPYLDAPAHVSFILKHPEYKELRAFPNSNYQFTVNNPKTYRLLSGMFKELIDANKGVEYVLLSNDEAYYTGKAANEIDSARSLGGNGKLLAQFISRMADTLRQYGRKVIFWGEYPLTPDDIKTLPRHLINGVYDSAWAPVFKERGIRQLIYTSTQGGEPLFPNYYPLPASKTLHKENEKLAARVPDLLQTITKAVNEKTADLAGVIVAGWADAGLHPQTFWLGYATGAAMGWNHSGTNADELAERFYATFYGTENAGLKRMFELTSRQAQFYEDSWEWRASNFRTPIFGNSAAVYTKPKPALDQSLLRLPVPDSINFSLPFNWADSNFKRLQLAQSFMKESDELMLLLNNANAVGNNRYNIEVIRTVANLCRQNILMLHHLEKISLLMQGASQAADKHPDSAIFLIDQCLDLTVQMKTARNDVLDSSINVWYKDWLPLVKEANGRQYLHAVDDVKDHRPIRTADMSYLIYRELMYPMDEWADETVKARNKFARRHSLKQRDFHLKWNDYTKRSLP